MKIQSFFVKIYIVYKNIEAENDTFLNICKEYSQAENMAQTNLKSQYKEINAFLKAKRPNVVYCDRWDYKRVKMTAKLFVAINSSKSTTKNFWASLYEKSEVYKSKYSYSTRKSLFL